MHIGDDAIGICGVRNVALDGCRIYAVYDNTPACRDAVGAVGVVENGYADAVSLQAQRVVGCIVGTVGKGTRMRYVVPVQNAYRPPYTLCAIIQNVVVRQYCHIYSRAFQCIGNLGR